MMRVLLVLGDREGIRARVGLVGSSCLPSCAAAYAGTIGRRRGGRVAVVLGSRGCGKLVGSVASTGSIR